MKKIFLFLSAALLFSCGEDGILTDVKPQSEDPKYRISISQAKTNTIAALQSEGIWPKLDMLQVRVDTTLSGAVYYSDWVDTSRHPISYGTIGSFIVNGGIVGSTTYRINTGFNPGNGGGRPYHYTQNSNSFGVYVGNRVAENKTDLSALNSSTQGSEAQSISTSPSLYLYNNGGTQTTTANDIGRGFYASKRTASNLWTSSVGGYVGKDFTDASIAIPNQPFWEYCKAVNTTYSKYTTRNHYFIFAGSGGIDLYKLNCIMEEYYLIPLGLAPTKRVTFLGNSYIANRVLVQQTMVALNDYNNLDLNVAGASGYTTPQVLTLAQTKVFPFSKSYLTKDVIFVDEFTNDYAATGGNATTCYNHMVELCDSIRNRQPGMFIIVMTMPPKTGAVNRQNDSNLNDTTYLNGMVRVKLVRDGHADAICDIACDSIIGLNGQNTNTTNYKTDGLHWNDTGTQRAVTNYIYPSIYNALQ